MRFPKISVVTITYNHEKFILDTIKSIISQKYDGIIEIIISNDKSPDKTDEIVKRFIKNEIIPDNIIVKYKNHQKNLGMMSNFIWSLNQATGDYIALCEGDDCWVDPLKLQKQVSFLEKYEKVGLVFSNCEEIIIKNGLNITSKIGIDKPVETREYSRLEILENWIVPTATVVFRSDLLKLNEFIDSINNNGFLFGDTPLFLHITRHSKLYGFSDITARYNRHQTGMTAQKLDLSKFVIHLESFIKVFGNEFNSKKIKRILADKYLELYLNKKLKFKFLFKVLKNDEKVFIRYIVRLIKQRLNVK